MAVTPARPRAGQVRVREVTGITRLGRRTKHLVKRLRPGDIAIINHRDLDRVSGEDLIACGVQAVVNCQPSSTGRYPNMGPLLLVQAGVHLVDVPDTDLFKALNEGDPVTVRGGEIIRGGKVVATGEVQDPETVQRLTDERRQEIGEALESFARNTVEHMVEERELLAGKLELPRFETDFRDRYVLIVVRGVDGGANAILEEGFKPDMIVGDMDSATEDVLKSGAELVVHAYPDGRAPGRDHLAELGLEHKVVPAPGTSQDIAMLIAAEKGARLIVSVGSQFNLIEFLDKNRRGMSSTFLTRLRIGEILVDAKGVSRLYRPRPGLGLLAAIVLTGLVTLAVIVMVTPGLHDVADLLWLKLQVLLGIKV
jgi:uncharacterized membrane-anchored protein